MPPKKKKGGKKKGKKKKDDATLEMEEKFKKALTEVEALKDHLAVRSELTRRAQSQGAEFSAKMKKAQEDLDEHERDQRSITADMSRQYKTMQSELNLKLQQTEQKLGRTTRELDETKDKLEKTEKRLEDTIKDKDEEIRQLKLRIDSIEISYKGIFTTALDDLRKRIEQSQHNWAVRSMTIQGGNRQTLSEFDLNPQEL